MLTAHKMSFIISKRNDYYLRRLIILKKTAKWITILAVSSLLAACQENNTAMKEDVSETVVTESTKDVHVHTNLTNEQKKIYDGYFDDAQVKDRKLSDWAGDWQSVYPYLLDGSLDEVFEHKASLNTEKTAEAYKEYYEVGYKTSVERIVIEGNHVTFYDHGHGHTGEYLYDGYEILTYTKGNRGVRYIFKLNGNGEGLPKYIQFSDHNISPKKVDHYHIYMGDDRNQLLEEMDNWPTFYFSHLDGHTIAHEMIAH